MLHKFIKPTSKEIIFNQNINFFDWDLQIKNNYIEKLNLPFFNEIKNASKILNQKTYVVGGWVRDLLLQRESKDIDVMTIGNSIDLVNVLYKSNPKIKNISVFKNFGTAMIKYNNYYIEFIGARKESYFHNSRNPIVENGTFEDDKNRRDFTINAIYISLNEKNYGELIDPFGGVKDLKLKIIKTPLDPSIIFSDDPLRMIRAIRFCSQLGFYIESKTYEGIKKNVERIKIISKERISKELNKILLSPKPSIGLNMLFDTGLLQYIIPELVSLSGVNVIEGQKHKDNFYHTLEVVDNIARKTHNLYLIYATLFHDIGKAQTKKFDIKNGFSFHNHEFVGSKMIKKIFTRLKLPLHDKVKYVEKMVLLSGRPSNLVDKEVSDSGIRRLLFDAGEDIDDLFLLCEADITTKNHKKMIQFICNFKKLKIKIIEIENKDKIRNFKPPITGDEIMKYFLLKPGPIIGKLKNCIKEAILDGKINNNKEESWELLKKEILKYKT